MKRKLLLLFLLLTMVFAISCNKKETTPDSTPAPTSTPTPVPVNQAKENLTRLVTDYDKFLEMNPNKPIDSGKGIGYDMTIDFTLGEQIAELLGITGLESIQLAGSVDMKDSLAMNLGLYLNASEIVSAMMFMDDENIAFNLPKYSDYAASLSMEELLNEAGYSDLTDIAESINPADYSALSKELTDSFRTCLTDLAACFKAVDGVTPKSSIGTGDYVMTGDKHTVKAAPQDIIAVLKNFEATLKKIYGNQEIDWTDLETSGTTALFLDYYTDEKGNFAWAFHTDDAPEGKIVFISTNLGFCLYKEENGTATPGMTSIKSTENSGVIYLFFDEEEPAEGSLAEPMGTIDYEYSETAVHADIMVDTIEASVDYSVKNDIVTMDMTLVMDGFSFVIEETASKDHAEITVTLASYGIKYASVTLNMTLRDFMDMGVPENTTDIGSWAAGLDQEALLSDLIGLMNDYPFLVSLFGLIGGGDGYDEEFNDWNDDGWNGSYENQEAEPFVLPSDYTDDFMNLTGWNVDSSGYIDFEPLEEEVLAAGKPSTGYDLLALSEDQLQKLVSIAETSVPGYELTVYPSYWIWGSAEYQDVESYYSISYEYMDPENWDNSICYTFDAVSGDFINVDIYNQSKDEAYRIANEIFTVLGGTYTITDTIAEESTYDFNAGFSFFGYDAAEFDGNYYNLEINVYKSEW